MNKQFQYLFRISARMRHSMRTVITVMKPLMVLSGLMLLYTTIGCTSVSQMSESDRSSSSGSFEQTNLGCLDDADIYQKWVLGEVDEIDSRIQRIVEKTAIELAEQKVGVDQAIDRVNFENWRMKDFLSVFINSLVVRVGYTAEMIVTADCIDQYHDSSEEKCIDNLEFTRNVTKLEDLNKIDMLSALEIIKKTYNVSVVLVIDHRGKRLEIYCPRSHAPRRGWAFPY